MGLGNVGLSEVPGKCLVISTKDLLKIQIAVLSFISEMQMY